MAYSLGLRIAVVWVYQEGRGGMRQVAELFGVGLSTVHDWIQRNKRGEPLEPSHGGGKPRSIHVEKEPLVHALLAERQDWTLDEIGEALRDRHGLILTKSCLWKTLTRMGQLEKNASYRGTRLA